MTKIDKNIEAHSPKDNVSGSEFPINTSRVVRYSDSDLLEFRGIVTTKLNQARQDYDTLRSTLNRTHENGTDDTAPSFKIVEEATDGVSKEEIARLAMRQQKFIEHLYNALVRIENKTYGICKISGKLIAKERLRIVPHTTMCIDAKLETSRIN